MFYTNLATLGPFFLLPLVLVCFSNGLPAMTNSSIQCGISEVQGHNGFFPWMAYVYMEDNDEHASACTATIVSPNYILTAAHCANQPTIRVAVGARDKRQGERVDVSQKFISPQYDHAPLGDIGLLKLKTPLNFDGHTIAPVCLGSKFEMGQVATIAGWGHQSFPIDFVKNDPDPCKYNDGDIARMMVGQVRLVAPADCVSVEDNIYWISNSSSQICTKPYDAQIEHGDSGGPLMVRDSKTGQWRQIGITSRGHCHFPEEDRYDPVIYTAVNYYCDWIQEKTDGEVSCDGE